jgi:hypothetical protein
MQNLDLKRWHEIKRVGTASGRGRVKRERGGEYD